MRGRQVLMQTLVNHGVDRIFGNPGTTESPLLDSLLDYPQIRYIVHLHEGVAVGAASFYAQASGKTAFVNLHVAPGLGNAIGMIYGALKNNSPMVVTAGQQDTRLRLRDPVLGHDLAAMAAPVTKWSVQVERADELGPVLQRAFKTANEAPAGPVFVALPIDVMEQETAIPAGRPATLFSASRPDPAGIAAMAKHIAAAKAPAIVAGDDVARAGAVDTLVRLVDNLGAAVWFEGLRGRNAFPTDHPAWRGTLAFDAPGVARQLAANDLVLMMGGPFFEEVWYAPGSPFASGTKVLQIEAAPSRLAYNFAVDAGVIANVGAALEALEAAVKVDAAVAKKRRAALEAQKEAEEAAQKARVEKAWSRSPTSMARAMAEIRAGSPEGVVVVDETITANLDLFKTFTFKGAGDYYSGRGGGIGQGVAGALGVAVADTRRPILCLSGDGSSMYSIQALWTAAHHDLPIVFVILANREYRVLKHNIDAYRARFDVKSNKPYMHMDLTGPALGFVDLARGMGVAGTHVTKADDINAAVAAAFASGKPHLLEIEIEGKR
ncbi:thiamine pyrophosphate-binding protein [Enhydrobacter sp.]|jgi:benzoylformate decarboxylase|uniref:thiamine pyrophosphate-binding protein n=1 Tax=Enhydrobacter sp. TaxID=1894999 RepID=UPI002622CCE5|nr:thiamine pyrophosphate-binding protein [Enhydrobacter sp.]WIM11469.1 MAG: Benzoylformate decarboxylase [Enhydrobacter sp.]